MLLALLLCVACRSPNNTEHDAHAVSDKAQPTDTAKAMRRTPEGTLRLLYDAVNKHDYETAYRLWQRSDGSNTSGKTFDEFVKGYEKTKTAEIIFTGSASIEGAAGSMYATVPARVEAVTTGGMNQTFVGEYVLRKSNVEAGSDTLPWHIESARFKLWVSP